MPDFRGFLHAKEESDKRKTIDKIAKKLDTITKYSIRKCKILGG